MVRLFLLRILESYFRHRWLYFLPVLVLTVVGAGYVFTREPEYLAKGVVFVKQESFLAQLTSVRDVGFSWNTPAQDVATELTDLMQTNTFIRAIIQKTDLEAEMDEGSSAVDDAIESVRTSIWAVPLGKNQILIGAGSDDPQVTYQLVNATIDNFIQWKINSDRIESETALNFFQDLLGTYKSELESKRQELKNYLLAHPQPVRGDRPDLELLEIDGLQSDLQVAGTRYSRALDSVESARLALAQVESNANQTYIVMDNPILPEDPEISRKTQAIQWAIFITIGGVVSLIGIGGGALLDRSFLFPIDVINLTGLSVLAAIPQVKEAQETKRRKKREFPELEKASFRNSQTLHVPSPNGNGEVVSHEEQVS